MAKAAAVGAPLIGECYANLECRLADDSQANEHCLFVSECMKAHVATRAVLWDAAAAWFNGESEASGPIDPAAAAVHTFEGGGPTWQIYPPDTPRDKKVPVAWGRSPRRTPWTTSPSDTGGRRMPWGRPTRRSPCPSSTAWRSKPAGRSGERGPRARRDGPGRGAVPAAARAGAAAGSWKKPGGRGCAEGTRFGDGPERRPAVGRSRGPAAGPFEAKLGDGSVATCYWYRFADQPALRNAALAAAEREAIQKRVELLHAKWTKVREYLPPPTLGRLADFNPAVVVTPPKGLEVGDVPVVTRQAGRE